jgi:hypothetical protein
MTRNLMWIAGIGFVMSIPELRRNAIFNLVLYNITYIVPLVGVLY